MSAPDEFYPVNEKAIALLYCHQLPKGKKRSKKQLADLLEINYTTFRVMEKGKAGNNPQPPYHATIKTCLKIVDGSENILGKEHKLSLDQVIDHKRPSTALSNKKEDYLKLQYSRFIGYDRHYSAAKDYFWYPEKIKLWQIDTPSHAHPKSLHFSGWAINALEKTALFALYGIRVSPFLFTLLGVDQELTHGCWQSICTKRFTVKNDLGKTVEVLSGFWGGVDNACHSAVFRGFFSEHPISQKMVNRLQFTHEVQPLLTSQEVIPMDEANFSSMPDNPPQFHVHSPHFHLPECYASRAITPASKQKKSL